MKEALFWERNEDGRLHCFLCPRHCRIAEGQTGFCTVRMNEGGTLRTLAYAQPYAVHVDPMEKKPLNHFLPGTDILSLGTAGCNMGCKFCQNWEMSRARMDLRRARNFPPEVAVRQTLEHRCQSIAFTYNEPTIWAEYVMDTSKLAYERGIFTVMVTNGYITLEALAEVYPHVDAANVDIKAFTEDFYREWSLSELKPVLEAVVAMRKLGVWVELTNLLIPTLNDSPEETKALCDWVMSNLGDRVPVHFTAFHPDYKVSALPPTPPTTLSRARRLALEAGLKYVYVGNVLDEEGSTTYCPGCREPLIVRHWHAIRKNLAADGKCPKCGAFADILTADLAAKERQRRDRRSG